MGRSLRKVCHWVFYLDACLKGVDQGVFLPIPSKIDAVYTREPNFLQRLSGMVLYMDTPLAVAVFSKLDSIFYLNLPGALPIPQSMVGYGCRLSLRRDSNFWLKLGIPGNCFG